jgi:hypothetical protein
VLFPGRRATIGLPALMLAALAVLAAGCGDNTQPRSLSSGSASPATPSSPPASQSSSPTASPTPTATGSAAIKKQLNATVRKYVAALNDLPHGMNAEAVSRTISQDCKCQEQVVSIRKVKQQGNHYTQQYKIVELTPAVTNSRHGEVLATLSETAGGIAKQSGKYVSRTPADPNLQRDFRLAKRHGEWLITVIGTIK